MILVSPELHTALFAPANQPVDLYELALDSGTLYYADQAISWNGHEYLAKVTGRSAIKRYAGAQFDSVSVTFSNVDTALAQVLLANEIEGRTLIIRKIDRNVSNDSIVLFHGPMERPGRINEREAVIEARQLPGSIDFDAPARQFGVFCPWPFKGYECGYAGPETSCDKSWSNCAALNNRSRFGAFRFIPHSGTFQYAETEEKRAWYTLGLLKRKKTRTITANFEAIDDVPYDCPVPIVYGRVQMSGIVVQHADEGGVTKALVAFCIGAVENLYFLRANNTAILDHTVHQGDLGGNGGQGVDPRFPRSYEYSLLAYAGVTIPSDVRTTDPAPAVMAVVRGRKVAIFDSAGQFIGSQWSDNPVWCTRDFMVLPLAQGGMGIPDGLLDDVVAAETAAYCDQVVVDTTNDQKIYNPPELPENLAYQRYQSTGVIGADPEVDGPYDEYIPGVDDDTSRDPVPVNVKRFTMNVAIAKQEKAVDILFKKLLPSFRGYLTFSKEGKIQIRCERPVKHSAIAAPAAAGANQILCSDPAQWQAGDILIASPLTAQAEVVTVAQVLADRLQFTTNLAQPHAAGETLLHVAMAFDDTNVIGSLEYPLSDRASSINRVTIKYVDAPAGFEARELRINDYDHQAAVHKVNNEDVDGSAIDSYFQAWRIGQWMRAKARDLARFCSLRADCKAALLEAGDVVAISGEEVGLAAVPFRVIEIGLEENDEVTVLGQLYSIDVYDDSAPQATVTVPAVFGQIQPPVTPDAPNVPEATAEPYYADAAGVESDTGTQCGLQGIITLPAAHENYGELRSIEVVATFPGGVERVLDTKRAPFAANTVAWRSAPWDRPAADVLVSRIEFRCINRDGAATAEPYARQDITIVGQPVPPDLPLSVSCSEAEGRRYLDRENNTHTIILPVATMAEGTRATRIKWWLSLDGGQTWEFPGSPSGELGVKWLSDESGFDVYAPLQAQQWCVKATTLSDDGENDPSAAVVSELFTVAGYSEPSPTCITDADIGETVYAPNANQTSWQWGQRVISWTNPTAEAEKHFWTAVLTVQLGRVDDGVFTPDPDTELGVEREVRTDATPGLRVEVPITGWWIPPATYPYRVHRFRLRVRNRAGAFMLQPQAWSGADHADVTPQVQATSLDLPGAVTLGAPLRDWEYIAGVWYQTYAIPVTPPNPLNRFDRMYVTLRAPDDLGGQKATILDDATPGFVIDEDPAAASTIEHLSEPAQKVELPWNPAEAVIRVKHPAPAEAEKWRIVVSAGAPHGRSEASASVVVDAGPPPAGYYQGRPGRETAEPVTEFAAAARYATDPTSGKKILVSGCAWKKPADIRYGGVVLHVHRSDYPEFGWRPLTGICTGESTEITIDPLPKAHLTLRLRAIQVDGNGAPSSYEAGVTPEATVEIDPPTVAVPLGNITGFAVAARYAQGLDGQRYLEFTVSGQAPSDAAFARIDFWAKGPTQWWYFPEVKLPGDKAYLDQLPDAAHDWQFLAPANDVNGKDADGNVDTNPDAPPAGTPSVTVTIPPPTEGLPLQNATGFSVDYAYLAPDYYGFEALRFTPTLTKPVDPSLAYFEFWGRRGDGETWEDWRVLGYPSGSGVKHAAVVRELPAAEEEWEFALVAIDVAGRNGDGMIETVPGSWPAGTPTDTLTVPPPSGKLDGHRIENIPAAAFAAGLTGTYLGTSLPALPDAKYPAGTPFILAPGGGQIPKMYRVNAAANGWTKDVDGADLVARTIYGTALAAGAVGTYELSTTEILVGPGGNRPIRVVVRDLFGALLFMTGDDGSIPFTGTYIRNVKIAPGVLNNTNYIQGDGNGIEIRGATVRVVGTLPSTEVNLGPTYVNPNYNELGVKACAFGGELWSWFIGRGLVVCSASGEGPGNVVGALVRHPSYASAAQMVLYGWSYLTTGNYVLADGADGTVRADNGFKVGGYIGRGTRAAPQVYNLALAGGGSVQVTFVGGLAC